MLRTMLRGVGALGLAATGVAMAATTAAAQWSPTGSNTVACAQGICDANWSVAYYGISALTAGVSGTLTNAPLATTIPSPPWAPNVSGVQQWIGASSDARLALRTGDNASNYRYFFTTTFSLPTTSTLSFGIGWDNKLVGAYQGALSIDALGNYTPGVGTIDLLGATPASPYAGGNSGFCRDGDGVYPSSQWPDCIVPISLDVTGGQMQTLTFVLQGDGETDGLLAGSGSVTNAQTTTPEPGSILLMATGIAALGAAVRLRRRSEA